MKLSELFARLTKVGGRAPRFNKFISSVPFDQRPKLTRLYGRFPLKLAIQVFYNGLPSCLFCGISVQKFLPRTEGYRFNDFCSYSCSAKYTQAKANSDTKVRKVYIDKARKLLASKRSTLKLLSFESQSSMLLLYECTECGEVTSRYKGKHSCSCVIPERNAKKYRKYSTKSFVDKNLAKRKACIDQGYKFSFIVVKQKGGCNVRKLRRNKR